MEKILNIFINTIYDYDFFDEFKAELKLIAPNAAITIASNKNVETDAMENAEIILGWMSEEQIKKAKNLKWLQLPSAGADRHTNKSLYCNNDIRLTSSSGVFSVAMAEHILGLMISFNRHLHFYARFQAEKRWNPMKAGRNIAGSTVGIIGLGDIGSEVAKRVHALGAVVVAVKRSPCVTPTYVDEMFFGEEGIDNLIKKCDYIILALPNTNNTNGVISEERLKNMKPGCFIVNVGRGSAIDQQALIKALHEGWIAGAGLDVTTPEPLPSDNPLWGMPNVLITPHASGYSAYNMEKILSVFKENLKRYVEAKPLINLIDFDAGY